MSSNNEAAWYRGAGAPAAASCPFAEGSDEAVWWHRGQAAAHHERARTKVRFAGGDAEADVSLFIMRLAEERDTAFKILTRAHAAGGVNIVEAALHVEAELDRLRRRS